MSHHTKSMWVLLLCVLCVCTAAFAFDPREARTLQAESSTRIDARVDHDEWSNYAQTAVSYQHACALTTSGAVECWGSNTDGQVGNGTKVNTNRPVRLATLSGITVTNVSANDANNACALTSSGSIYCWGQNAKGYVGDGTTTERTSPTLLSTAKDGSSSIWPLPTFAQVAVSGTHSCALDTVHRMFCWGDNTGYVLDAGSGSFNSYYTAPTLISVPIVETIARVAVGGMNTCVLTTNGDVYCWGVNTLGAIGNGSNTDANVANPKRVLLPDGVVAAAISVSADGACALTTTGEVYCWGGNLYGQLGDGTTTHRNAPVLVTGLTGLVITEIDKARTYTCAVTTTHLTYCWGTAPRSLGNSSGTYVSSVPVLVQNPTDETIVHVNAGTSLACLTAASGNVYCWGQNNSGLAGFCADMSRSLPTRVGYYCEPSATATPAGPTLTSTKTSTYTRTLSPTKSPTSTNSATLTKTPSKTATVPTLTPSKTSTPTLTSAATLTLTPSGTWHVYSFEDSQIYTEESLPAVDLSSVVSFSDGGYYHLAALSNGSVVSWGASGGLYSTGATVPADLQTAGAGVVEVAAGGTGALARKSDGTVVAWGCIVSDSEGTLPCQLPAGMTSIRKIYANEYHVRHAISTDNRVFTWGATLTTNAEKVYTWYSGYTDVVDISMGYNTTSGAIHPEYVVRADGTVESNAHIVHGEVVGQASSAVISGLTDIVDVEAQFDGVLALKRDGTLWCWCMGTVSQVLPGSFGPVQAVEGLGNKATVLLRNGTGIGVTYFIDTYVKSSPACQLNNVRFIDSPWSGVFRFYTPNTTTCPTPTPRPPTETATKTFTPSRTRTPCAALCGYALEAWGLADNPVVYATQRDLSGVTAVDAGLSYAVALRADGSVTTIGGYAPYLPTTPAGASSGVTAVAAGGYNYVMALKTDGTIVASGGDSSGDWLAPIGLTGVTKIDASRRVAGALKSDGTVVLWPESPTNTFSGVLTPPAEATGLTAFALGDGHAVALKSDGTVVAWGMNANGQATVPAGLTGVTAVAAGDTFSMALKSDGTVVTWGVYATNVCCDTAPLTIPPGTTGITKIVAGPNGALLGRADGTWIGIGSYAFYDATVPAVPAGLNNITQVTLGQGFAIAIVGTPGAVLTATNTPTATPVGPTQTPTKSPTFTKSPTATKPPTLTKSMTPTRTATKSATRTPTKASKPTKTPTKKK